MVEGVHLAKLTDAQAEDVDVGYGGLQQPYHRTHAKQTSSQPGPQSNCAIVKSNCCEFSLA